MGLPVKTGRDFCPDRTKTGFSTIRKTDVSRIVATFRAPPAVRLYRIGQAERGRRASVRHRLKGVYSRGLRTGCATGFVGLRRCPGYPVGCAGRYLYWLRLGLRAASPGVRPVRFRALFGPGLYGACGRCSVRPVITSAARMVAKMTTAIK